MTSSQPYTGDNLHFITGTEENSFVFKTGADPGFFLGGGAPLRNDITDGEVKKKKSNTYTRRRKLHLRGGGGAPPAPSP